MDEIQAIGSYSEEEVVSSCCSIIPCRQLPLSDQESGQPFLNPCAVWRVQEEEAALGAVPGPHGRGSSIPSMSLQQGPQLCSRQPGSAQTEANLAFFAPLIF